jgi:hypothetical protein
MINVAGSTGQCNTIWYKAVFKGGVYEAREVDSTESEAIATGK